MWFRSVLGFSVCIALTLASLEAAGVQEVYDTAADEFAGALIGESKSDYLTSTSDAYPHGALIADINGDGYGDVIAGAPRYGSDGRIYVAWGASDLSGERDLASGADFTVSGSSTSGNISGAMATGDLNDDGV
ncbi:MAG: integrin alpha, partial [Myxococcota bacterium]|nr:integrin alpha [Myxococcota bacterium]